MQAEEFIVVLLTLIVINVITAILLKILTGRTSAALEANVINRLSTYDTLIEKKSETIKELQKREQELQSEIESKDLELKSKNEELKPNKEITYQENLFPKTATYVDETFTEKYLALKNRFYINKPEILKKLVQDTVVDPQFSDYQNIKKIFDLEFSYQLMNGSPSEQKEWILSKLEGKEKQIFIEYCEQHPFSLKAWKMEIDEKLRLLDPTIHVYSGNQHEDFSYLSNYIEMHVDNNICEGFMIRQGNKLFDYSLQKKEIS